MKPVSLTALAVIAILLLLRHATAVAALALLRQSLSPRLAIDPAISRSALFAGSLLGRAAFRSINEVVFRRSNLMLLLLSGVFARVHDLAEIDQGSAPAIEFQESAWTGCATKLFSEPDEQTQQHVI